MSGSRRGVDDIFFQATLSVGVEEFHCMYCTV